MKTRSIFMTLASLSLFIMVIGGWSLRYGMTAVSSLTAEIVQASRELSAIDAVSTELTTLSLNILHYLPNKEKHRREACENSRTAVHRMLDTMIVQDSNPGDRSFPALLHGSFGAMETSLDKLFSLKDPAGGERESARRLLLETLGFVTYLHADIGKFRKGKIETHSNQIADRTRALQTSVVLFVVMTLLLTTLLLFGFVIFIHRTVSVPLNKLKEGAKEFGRGNLDYRLPLQGTDEISLLAGQMNDMADSLKHSLRELDDKLSESTNALAASGRMEIAVRHEINNPLTTVIGSVELLIERYEHKDKDLTARLEVVLNNALRIAEITKRLRKIKEGKSVNNRTGMNLTDVP